MFALIVFGMYCVTVFFIILSMFFAMVSAAQEAIEEANASCDLGVPLCRGAFTPSTRLVSISR